LFAEYTFDLIENFKIIAGLRADWINEIQHFNSSDISNTSKVTPIGTPRLHLKYGILPDTFIVAGSVGRGYRVARELAENSGYLASNRNYIVYDYNTIEEAWTYGINMYYTTKLFGCPVDFNMDFYRTDFINQVIVDLDSDPDEVYIYSLENNPFLVHRAESYSNAFQVDATFEPITNFFITAAYRMIDVKQTTAGELREKPLQSRNKAFLNFQYNTEMNEWAFDLTFDYNGSGRLPMDADGTIKRYDPFVLLNAQITYTFGNIDIYIGGENLTNYRIPNPIKGFDNPFGPGFDASMIYGPIRGMCLHAGIRYKIY
jgi:outer membrane receptor for ferrienterochelin and colicin